MTFHHLRHTFASWLAQRGHTLLRISKLPGNTVAVCEKHYAGLIPDLKLVAAKAIDEVLEDITEALALVA